MRDSYDQLTNQLVVQGPGKPASALSSLRELISRNDLDRLRAAVAFATPEGVRLLQTAEALRRRPLETSIVVTLDGLITQPQALRDLRKAYDQRFRVIETSAVRSIFHAKAFFLDSRSADQISILLGSANLTGQGMGRNTELGIVVDAHGAQAQELRAVWNTWWDDLWAEADTVTDTKLAAYERQYASRSRQMVQGDRIVEAQQLKDPGDSPAVSVADAAVLWVDTGAITGGSRNQLEIPRSVAAYFGNITGPSNRRSITLRLGHRKWADNILAYYPRNGMWRLNINTDLLAESGGLTDETVFFEREGSNAYQFKILTFSEVNALRNISESTGGVGETPTREYGWH